MAAVRAPVIGHRMAGERSTMLSTIAYFNSAKRSAISTLAIGLCLAGIASVYLLNLYLPDYSYTYRSLPLPAAAGLLCAALYVAAAGFLSTATMSFSRYHLLVTEGRQVSPRQQTSAGKKGRLQNFMRGLSGIWRHSAIWIRNWLQIAIAAALALLSILSAVAALRTGTDQQISSGMQQLFGGGLIGFAFPLLVIERFYATKSEQSLPEAPQLMRLLRLPLLSAIALGGALFIMSAGFIWMRYVETAVAGLIIAIAAEVIIRCGAMLFVPFKSVDKQQAVADSFIAGLLRWEWPDVSAMNTSVHQNFGIDLSRSWALYFMRRSFLPLTAGFIVFAWCLTGITTLTLEQRGVIERFGSPVGIVGPGLHFHLPWPFGAVKRVELGTVHEIPVAFSGSGEQTSVASQVTSNTLPSAEGPPPENADRLWDASHPSESSYLIASQSRGQQSFQVADADLRIVYRIGLTDEAALAATYSVDSPETIIRAIAAQQLIHYFARTTLDEVLGESREAFTTTFRQAMQSSLDRSGVGVEIIAVIVEAIHPPPGAASAYHYVQASEITAITRISQERGRAIETGILARRDAALDHNSAEAGAAERVSQARTEQIQFSGDVKAYAHGATPFMLERWLDKLRTNLRNAKYIIVDHRLSGASRPTLDMRGLLSSSDVTAASPIVVDDDEDP